MEQTCSLEPAEQPSFGVAASWATTASTFATALVACLAASFAIAARGTCQATAASAWVACRATSSVITWAAYRAAYLAASLATSATSQVASSLAAHVRSACPSCFSCPSSYQKNQMIFPYLNFI